MKTVRKMMRRMEKMEGRARMLLMGAARRGGGKRRKNEELENEE